MNDQKAFFYAILGNMIFGFSYLFSKMALAVASPMVLVSVRFVVAFLLMTAARPFLKHKPDFRGKNVLPLFLLGLIQPVAYFLCETYGLQYSTASFSGTIIALIPIFCLVIAALTLGERTTMFQKLCVVASVVGVIITGIGKNEGTTTALGFVLLLGAAFSGAICNVMLRKFSTQFAPFEQNYVMFGFGSVVFAVMALVQYRNDLSGAFLPALSSWHFWIAIVFLAAFSSIGAFLLITTALGRLPASLVSPLSSIISLVSILSGIIFLRERITLLQAIGSLIIVVSTYLINASTRSGREAKSDPAETSAE